MVNPAIAGEEPGSFCVGLKPQGLKRKAGRSRVNREVHARFCEGLGVKFPRATRLRVNNEREIELQMSTMYKIKYYRHQLKSRKLVIPAI